VAQQLQPRVLVCSKSEFRTSCLSLALFSCSAGLRNPGRCACCRFESAARVAYDDAIIVSWALSSVLQDISFACTKAILACAPYLYVPQNDSPQKSCRSPRKVKTRGSINDIKVLTETSKDLAAPREKTVGTRTVAARAGFGT